MGKEYKKLFGVEFSEKKMTVKDLPIYLSANRSFKMLSYSGFEFILVRISSDEKFGVVAFDKQIKQISSKYGKPVALSFDNISRSQRDSLIGKNIPFISDSGQLYLPFLGMILSNRFYQDKNIVIEKMMPATQALFLYMLYKSNGEPVMKKDAADYIGITRTSITRASDQLAAMGLISQKKSGRENYMTASEQGIEYYEKARPYLITPLQKTIVTAQDNEYDSLFLSGESALAKHSMLNEPPIPARAVYKSMVDADKIPEEDIRWNEKGKAVNLELWKYDPSLFSSEGTVDPVSLAMCYQDNEDERIENAIEEYLEGYKW